MKRVLFDTSVYGRLVIDENITSLIREKFEKHEYIVYGSSIIRNELRDTPKHVKHGKYKLRILLLLNLYDSFIKKEQHNLKFNKLVAELADDYFTEYKKNNGALSKKSIINDFIIIATATIYQLDIIISDDERTMLSDKSIIAYKNINKKYGFINPVFKKYNKFRKELLR